MAEKSKKRKPPGPRGSGAVFYSEAHGRWIWRAITGHKPDGRVSYTEGRARTQREAIERKKEAEKGNRQPHSDAETVGDHLDYWLNDVAKPNTRPNTWVRYESVVRL